MKAKNKLKIRFGTRVRSVDSKLPYKNLILLGIGCLIPLFFLYGIKPILDEQLQLSKDNALGFNRNHSIYEEVKKIQQYYQSDRSGLSLTIDFRPYIKGDSSLRARQLYEAVRPGMPYMYEFGTQLQISLLQDYPIFMAELWFNVDADNLKKVSDAAFEKRNPSEDQIYRLIRYESYYGAGIRNSSGQVIGFLWFHYLTRLKSLEKEDLKYLLAQADKISRMLESKKVRESLYY